MAVDVGETEVASLETVSETFMINAKQVLDGGMEIVNMHLVFGSNIVSEIISFTEGCAAFNATTSKPHGVTGGVVIATVICCTHLTL